MFFRRKFYIVNNDFIDIFNKHFNETNLPNQLKNGARLVGRWMAPHSENTTEIFAIWEYDSFEKYEEIERNVRSDKEHHKKIVEWYERHGGRERVYEEYLLEVKNEELISTVPDETRQFRTRV
ncbi:NIPSNAP family protein [Paenibacillus sp. N1-5-1-14]|uniref:NIPSNAP family protein n=1 Tax=Paenibacillus radicibacter TaxID=2972488 RepID=UPI002159775F|nr:NIPSNAP family protein [Paenibacillus radicibacter]MCR8646037.1 NIPSNAP family protein [Paenibacillus radicibacter]